MILTIYMSMFLVLACIDMGIKQYIEDTLEKDEERETLIPGLVLRKVHNKGFAFNILEHEPGIIRKSSVCAAAGILIYDCWLFLRKKRTVGKIGMVLVSAGAVSNLYDRLIRRTVIDYIGIKSEKKRISDLTANLADVYLTVGAVLTGISGMAHRKKVKK
ncbi:MAG: signal peptidase II [Dorea sp.]|jgi:signal peptidase II|nr:signal peptidase II [Dorea sp.]